MLARSAIALLTCCLATPAYAQLIEITPDTFGKVKALAETARASFPESPTNAVTAFETAFVAEFGPLRGANETIVETRGLSVRILTPIYALYLTFSNAIRNRTAFADDAPPSYVAINVRATQPDAPNVTRVTLFRDDKEVPPEINNLAPLPIANWNGGTILKTSGLLFWKSDVFTTPGIVKVAVITDGPVYQWEYWARKPGQ